MASNDAPMRPREQQALDIWESLPESTRSYQEVGDRMGVTGPRAGVYVRDAIEKSGKLHLLPQRGRKGITGGNASVMVEEDGNPMHDIERLLASVGERIKSLTDRLAEADEAAANFDAETAVEEETARLQKIVDEAQASLDAFSEEDAQTKWATQQQEHLNARKREVESDTETRVATLRAKEEGLKQLIALAKDNPSLAEMFASSVSDEEKDEVESLTNDPTDGDTVKPEGETADDAA